MTRVARAVPGLRWFVSLVAGPPAVCAVGLALFRPEDASWWLAGSLCGLWLGLLVLARRPTTAGARAAVAVSAVLLFMWPEMALRVAGFRADSALSIQFGYPPPELMVRLRHDPELFWKLPVGHPGSNSEGFIGGEFEIPKPEDTYRVLFFGDSCTMQGFPARVPPAMAQQAGRRYDAINFGVAGYTSHQGLVLARRWTKTLEPDVGVIFFGWNDHWLAFGAPDSQKAVAGLRDALRSATRASRVAQWFAGLSAADAAAPLDVARVSVEEYSRNIEAIGALVEAEGGSVLLLTAPTSMYSLGVPDYLIPTFAKDARAVLDQHRAYNDVVRAVAAQRGWRLLDLAQELPADRVEELISGDRIHFTDAGLAWVAGAIAEELPKLRR